MKSNKCVILKCSDWADLGIDFLISKWRNNKNRKVRKKRVTDSKYSSLNHNINKVHSRTQ